ncbi:GDP-L-fucose synthase [Thiorhodovibrio litoralis]|uniref:GDP-L-fucose synthase n=1 Tax=Thiorhodovibrio litoralis TaxID=2952932 RepID=UPI002B25A690|nr:GDP-L-fucose synthase [Thiorhodovibrio litoralis]WPL11520.1 GDP-L-fucose synthase [Thiorhodovibrio litoralis]
MHTDHNQPIACANNGHSSKRIFVAGHRGMVGSAIVRNLQAAGQDEIITRGRNALDLTDSAVVEDFFASTKPTQVYLAAAKVGGIWANDHYPAEFIHSNLSIASNVIHSAWRHGTERLLFLGSSCIYPRLAPQPMAEDALLSGPLEPTNEPYAIAKIAGIKLCESYNRQYGTDYRSVMPTNLYGPGDNFDLENSHVIPALLRKFHDAKQAGAASVDIWGTGAPKREFLHVDDMAAACLYVMNLPTEGYQAHTPPRLSHINVGTGQDISIRELAETVREVVGFAGELRFDTSKPDGPPRKLLDVSRLRDLGWQAGTGLRDGLQQTYAWFLEHQDNFRH